MGNSSTPTTQATALLGFRGHLRVHRVSGRRGPDNYLVSGRLFLLRLCMSCESSLGRLYWMNFRGLGQVLFDDGMEYPIEDAPQIV